MTIKQRIKFHRDNKKYCEIERRVAEDSFKYNNGYIVDYTSDFIVFQEVNDFKILGFSVFPISTVSLIRFNAVDKYYDKMMRWEKQTNNVFKKHDIDLTSWSTIFKTIKKTGLNVIVENEEPDDESFDIGLIIKVTKTAVDIQYFNPKGYLDDEATRISLGKITIVKFDDHYVNTFSKYLRQRKVKTAKS